MIWLIVILVLRVGLLVLIASVPGHCLSFTFCCGSLCFIILLFMVVSVSVLLGKPDVIFVLCLFVILVVSHLVSRAGLWF